MALSNALFPGLKAYSQEIARAEVCLAQAVAVCGPLIHWLSGSSWFAATVAPVYFFADMFFVQQNEYLLHHILVTLLAYGYYFVPLSEAFTATLLSTIIGMEISTIFLNVRTMARYGMIRLPSKVVLANNLVFLATFFKFRIWDGTWLLLNPVTWDAVGAPAAVPLYVGLLGIYCLNLYWARLIAKQALKLLLGRAGPHTS